MTINNPICDRCPPRTKFLCIAENNYRNQYQRFLSSPNPSSHQTLQPVPTYLKAIQFIYPANSTLPTLHVNPPFSPSSSCPLQLEIFFHFQ